MGGVLEAGEYASSRRKLMDAAALMWNPVCFRVSLCDSAQPRALGAVIGLEQQWRH
jgi:hypothetical protein